MFETGLSFKSGTAKWFKFLAEIVITVVLVGPNACAGSD